MRIVEVIRVPCRVLWGVLRLPYICWCANGWRYRIGRTEAEECIRLFRKGIAYLKGRVACEEPTLGEVFMVRYVGSYFLRQYYTYLKKKHRINQGVASEAFRFFKSVMPIFIGSPRELVSFLEELKFSNYEDFSAHDLGYFKECRGNIFSPNIVSLVQNVLPLRRDIVNVLKVTYIDVFKVVKRSLVSVQPIKDELQELLVMLGNCIGLSEKLPIVFSVGMGTYADFLARWALVEGDVETSATAIAAAQRMRDVRQLLTGGRLNRQYRKALSEYFDHIGKAGAKLYARLIAPKQLTNGMGTFPPTRQEIRKAQKIAKLERCAVISERENAAGRAEVEVLKEELKAIVANPMSVQTMKEPVRKTRRSLHRTEWTETRDAVVAWLMERAAQLFTFSDKSSSEFNELFKGCQSVKYIAHAAFTKVVNYGKRTKAEREKGFRVATVGEILDSRGKRLQKGGADAKKVDETAHGLYLVCTEIRWFNDFESAVKSARRPLLDGSGEWKISAEELWRRVKNRIDHEPSSESE